MVKGIGKLKIWLPLVAFVLLCGYLGVSLFNASSARYEKNAEKTTIFKYQASNEQLHLLKKDESGAFVELGEWVYEEEKKIYSLDYVLTNGTAADSYCSREQDASLCLFASLGLGSADNAKVSLIYANVRYQGTACEIQKDSALYLKYGAGWIYRFYDKDGNELSWNLSKTAFDYKEMRLELSADAAENAMLKLIAKPSLAHVISSACWQTQLEKNEKSQSHLSCELFSENGKNIIINSTSEITVDISAEGLSENEELKAKLEIENFNFLSITADETDLTFNADGTKQVKLSFNLSSEERAEDATASVKIKYADKTLVANFIVLKSEPAEQSGTLASCTSQFSKETSIYVKAGNENVCLGINNEKFPSMTEYKIGDKEYVLYEPGYIALNANEEAKLTGISFEKSVSINNKNVKYVKTADAKTIKKPIVIDKSGTSIPLSYKWGDINPNIKVYELVREANNSSLKWKEINTINVTADADGKLCVGYENAAAGTYKLSISCLENDKELHSMEIPFFIQNEATSGGNIQ